MRMKRPQQSLSTFRHPFPEDGGIDRARMRRIVEENWLLNRSAVNPDTDRCAANLCRELDATVLEVPAGAECLTWQMPMHWAVRKGQLRTTDGRVLADYAENPLRLWTHSIPYQGEIDRETLLAEHVATDPTRPHEFIYHYRNGFRFGAKGWGFSLEYATVEQMTDPTYVVDIDADLDLDGSLKVVDAFLPGQNPETIFVMAHTCHPGLVSDGIGCIAAAIELYHQLKALPSRVFSYRFLFGPEYFAGAAWLSHAAPEAVDSLYCGLYLDMLTTQQPLGYQHSMQGDARIDKVVANVLKSHTEVFIERPYRRLWGNDETFFNGPGFLKPMAGLGRVMHREYHYNTDNLDNLDMYHMVESVWVMQRIAEVFETDYVPVPTYKGPLYLSRYDLYIDPSVDKRGALSVEKMQALADGERSVMDIAEEIDVDFFFVRNFFDQLAERQLVAKQPRQPRSADAGTLQGPVAAT